MILRRPFRKTSRSPSPISRLIESSSRRQPADQDNDGHAHHEPPQERPFGRRESQASGPISAPQAASTPAQQAVSLGDVSALGGLVRVSPGAGVWRILVASWVWFVAEFARIQPASGNPSEFLRIQLLLCRGTIEVLQTRSCTRSGVRGQLMLSNRRRPI